MEKKKEEKKILKREKKFVMKNIYFESSIEMATSTISFPPRVPQTEIIVENHE